MKLFANLVLAAALAAGAPVALAHTAHHQGGAKPAAESAPSEQKPWGIAGDAGKVGRTIHIEMGDDMRFKPSRIEVRQGETVRLVVRNAGKLMHELVIGTRDELDRHAALMARFPDMAHDEPWMAHVDPGRSGELVWNFNRPGAFDYACLIPGHYQAGMVGSIQVIPAKQGASQ